jgi:hypothetical protein
VRVVLLALVLTGASVFLLQPLYRDFPVPVYGLSLLATVPAAFWLLGTLGESTATGRGGNRRVGLWVAVLLADLWALAWPLVRVGSEKEVYAPPPVAAYLARHSGEPGRGRVLDRGPAEPGRDVCSPLGTGAPLATLLRIEGLRGFNPLDVLRYREYLLFASDEDRPLRPLEGPFTGVLIGNFPVKNKALLDLLGVRYLVQPSDMPLEQEGWDVVYQDRTNPVAFDFLAGGLQELPLYTVYENRTAFPRVFIVPEAAPLPDRPDLLPALRDTDFRRKVLLEGFAPGPEQETLTGKFSSAVIREYLPNRVVVEVDGDKPGYLVLTDIWYPGWICTVDGEPARLYRADYLFRAVTVPAGAHEVTFRFAPASYRWGMVISAAALAVVLGVSLLAFVRSGLSAIGSLPTSHRTIRLICSLSF